MKGIYNENFKTVRKEIEVDTERLHSLMNGQNTVTMAMFTQAIYRFNTISAIPTRMYMYNYNIIHVHRKNNLKKTPDIQSSPEQREQSWTSHNALS